MAFEIVKPSEATEGFHGVLYGAPKVGKTSTLDDPNFKVLLLDLEGGSAVLSEADKVDRIPIADYKTLLEVGKAIETGELKGYDLYAIDSLTQFEDYVKDYVVSTNAPNRKRPVPGQFGAESDWGDLKLLITRTVKWFHQMTKRGDNSIHLMWIAHVMEDKDDVTHEILRTKVALQGKTTADVVMSVVDGVFYMYNKSIRDENGSVTGVERGILTKPAGYFVANARQSKKRDPLPAKIVDPVWSEVFSQLGYVKADAKHLASKK